MSWDQVSINQDKVRLFENYICFLSLKSTVKCKTNGPEMYVEDSNSDTNGQCH